MSKYDRMRELLVQAYYTLVAWQPMIASSYEDFYGKICLEQICYLREALNKLGIEVD